MKYATILVLAALTGCASGPSEPMTPEQAAIIMEMTRNQQAINNSVYQRQSVMPPVFQPQNMQYQAPPPPRQLNCQTIRVYNTYQTRCY